MVDFAKREDVKAWLDAIEPEERRREAAIVIAARAALRVVPLLQRAVDSKSGGELDWALSEIVLPSFRCVALPLATATYPTHDNEFRSAYSASVAPRPTRAAGFSSAAYHSARAAETIYSAKDTNDVANVIASADSAADAAGVSFNGVLPAATLDARRLDTGRLPAELAREPLWLHQGGLHWATAAWAALRARDAGLSRRLADLDRLV